MGLLSSSRGSHRAGVEGQTWRPWSRGAGMLLWERYRSGLPGYGQKRRKSRGKEAKREPRARATPTFSRSPRRGWARRVPVGRRRAREGAYLGLLLGKAGLGRDQAQRGGVRVLVDLVEVVLQDLHLVLSGAARGLRRHGPDTAAGEGEAAG